MRLEFALPSVCLIKKKTSYETDILRGIFFLLFTFLLQMNKLQVGVGLNHWGHSDLEAKKKYLNAVRFLKSYLGYTSTILAPKKISKSNLR